MYDLVHVNLGIWRYSHLSWNVQNELFNFQEIFCQKQKLYKWQIVPIFCIKFYLKASNQLSIQNLILL
jgi:hypothetical protein